jgi:hypothetical protein
MSTLLGVDAPHVDRIVLDLEPGEPIRGSICAQSGRSQRFYGWLDLASRLERLQQASDVGASTPDQQEDD